mgnify:CR=1 FL=1
MNKILLRIADLRKKAKVTQQELADSIGVSFQTISKWETRVNLPDITILHYWQSILKYRQISY